MKLSKRKSYICNMNISIDITTPAAKIRAAKDARVADMYHAIRADHPEATPTRIITVMAASGKCGFKSIAGIRNSLKRTGNYE